MSEAPRLVQMPEWARMDRVEVRLYDWPHSNGQCQTSRMSISSILRLGLRFFFSALILCRAPQSFPSCKNTSEVNCVL